MFLFVCLFVCCCFARGLLSKQTKLPNNHTNPPHNNHNTTKTGHDGVPRLLRAARRDRQGPPGSAFFAHPEPMERQLCYQRHLAAVLSADKARERERSVLSCVSLIQKNSLQLRGARCTHTHKTHTLFFSLSLPACSLLLLQRGF